VGVPVGPGPSTDGADHVEINPFLLPGWEESPLRPLCPWQHAEHAAYYVDVNHTQDAFLEFVHHMANPAGLVDDGRLVVVTGESGCGKTALINRCASWTIDALDARSLRGIVVDLTREGGQGQRRTIPERMGIVCARLLDELRHRRLLSVDVIADLKESWDQPDRVYPNLGNYLDDGLVLVVLLPPVDELVAEVIDYAGFARRRLLFFVESSYLDQDQVRQVQRSQHIPPVALRVGPLNPGDVRRFIEDRLGRHADNGRYPRISEDTMHRAAGPLRSIAMLQRILSGVYEDRLRRSVNYTGQDWVSYENITEFFFEEFLNDMRTDR
jgi:hypothetical protein